MAQLLKLHLEQAGCQVELVRDGPGGLARGRSGSFDLIVLDLTLPALDGIEVCRQLRADGVLTPLLMLTARAAEQDRVRGLDVGADDYLVKPFSVAEFVSRANAIFRRQDFYRRQGLGDDQGVLDYGALRIAPDKREVSLRGKSIVLTAKEFDLLLVLARQPGRPFSRAQLLDLVWGYGYSGYDATVKSHVNRLRAKLEDDASNPHYILTVWGTGYKFFDPEPGP